VSVGILWVLYLTIYGIGLAFLGLLVLMIPVTLLGKLGAAADGPASAEEAPGPADETVRAPLPGTIRSVAVTEGACVCRGDELCVLETAEMVNSVRAPRGGLVLAVEVAPGDAIRHGVPLIVLAATASVVSPQPAAIAMSPAAAAARSALRFQLEGTAYAAEITVATDGTATVLLDGSRYTVRRDPGDRRKFIVNGAPHTVEVPVRAGDKATVLIDGTPQTVALAPPAPEGARTFALTCAGTRHAIEITTGAPHISAVRVDGVAYQVAQDPATPASIRVDGQPHTVEVREVTGTAATVLIDGRPETLGLLR
jgi:pyruvate/2-oxoglutarate dehydrogenase complex dihydrolipoamide acyltransferase (E2) component